MVSYKLDKYDKYFIAFILVIITIFNISQCFAVENEDVDFSIVSGLVILSNQNYFSSNSAQNVGYFEIEKGYIYNITNNSEYGRTLAYSDTIPALNVPYNFITTLNPGETYSFISNSNSYLYFAFSNTPSVTVSRSEVEGQTSAINDLVQNVGPQQLWSVFESGIDFIGVVVLVAFGLFLIVLLIKKLSKGKSDF